MLDKTTQIIYFRSRENIFKGKRLLAVAKIACYTEAQQEAYESLSSRQRAYVENRVQGYNRSESYRLAGYGGKNHGQAASLLEKNNPVISNLIETRLNNLVSRAELDQRAKLEDPNGGGLVPSGKDNAVVTTGDDETVKRIRFYRAVLNGALKTTRKTTFTDRYGNVTTRVEEIDDVETKMKARKELDRILGLNSIVDIDKFQVGSLTVNIVDASNREQLEDPKNKVNLEVDAFVTDVPQDEEPKKKRGRKKKDDLDKLAEEKL